MRGIVLETGKSAAGPFRRFLLREGQEFHIAVRRPWKRINPEEPQHVVNAVEMENFFDVMNSSSPPIEIAPAQFIPAIVRDAPILSPFLGEGVHLEDLLRW